MFPVGRPISFGEAAETSGSHRPRSRWSALDVHSETEASIVWKRTPHKADDLVAKGAPAAACYWTLATDLIRDFFGKVPLVAPGLRNRLDDVVSGDREGWFSTTLRAKDLRLADQLARSHGLRLPVGETVRTLYEQGRPKDGPRPTSRRSSS